MKATLNWTHEIGKKPSAKASLSVPAGGVKLRATVTEASILSEGPSLEGVVLALEKPDAFILDYHVQKRDCHFKFMNTIRVLEKPLKFAYKHEWCDKSTDLHGTLKLGNDNEVSADCTLGSKNNKYKLKYTHNLNKGLTTLEPSYDVVHKVFDLAVSQKLYDMNTLKVSYNTSNNNLGLKWSGLKWSLASKHNGIFETSYQTSSEILGLKWLLDSEPHCCFEIQASMNLREGLKVPNVSAKTTFNFEM